jgi:signal transduction histidine kinase
VRRIPWQLVTAALLLVALGVLGTLQYRWLGAVSDAERERMRTSLRARATELGQEVNGELTRIYAAFRADTAGLDAEPAKAIANAYMRWRDSALHPDLVKAIYLVEGGDASAQPRRFDAASGFLVPTDWPPELKGVLQHPGGPPQAPPIANLPTPLFLVDSVNAQIPALVIAVPRISRNAASGHVTVITDPVAIARSIVIVLDNDRLVHEIVEPAVAKQFGEADSSDYLITIVRRDDPSTIVFKTGATEVSATTADVVVGLFDLRMDDLARMAEGGGGFLPRLRTTERVAITIVRKGGSTDDRHMIAATADEQGAWQLRARYRSGSLDSIVAASRRRNIAVGLGVLSLLAASVGLVIVSAQRQQRLARQQMEFVAAVSHELRTPLAVICSAGENLADGVVSDPAQIRRYGSLVETEGRRLGAMVERVLDFAGMSSGNGLSRGDVNVSHVIAEAVRGLDADAHDRGVTIAVHDAPDGPHVIGDGDALRSAVQNVVGNAVKYSPRGATVDVATEVEESTVRIRVADRGLGIDAQDLPHIFKPFYRGRRAIDAEVRGSGVGLSVVRHVVDAHHGRIQVDSRPGDGTIVTLDLPMSVPESDSESVPEPVPDSDPQANGGKSLN